jgi:hypothetical protein
MCLACSGLNWVDGVPALMAMGLVGVDAQLVDEDAAP